jgi:hypothetical protein
MLYFATMQAYQLLGPFHSLALLNWKRWDTGSQAGNQRQGGTCKTLVGLHTHWLVFANQKMGRKSGDFPTQGALVGDTGALRAIFEKASTP